MFGLGEFVGVVPAHQRPVFGQQHPVGTGLGGSGHLLYDAAAVDGGVGMGNELDGSGADGLHGVFDVGLKT